MGLATQPMDSLSVARRLFDAFSDGGTDAIADMLAPDVIARPQTAGSPVLEGRAAVREYWADLAVRGTEIEVRPLEFELHGDTVIVRGYLRRRDGRTLAESQVFWLYEVHEGLVTRMESHPSRASALDAVATA